MNKADFTKTYFTLVFVLFICNGNLLAQIKYKGEPKHVQLNFDELSKPKRYNFNKKLSDSLEIKLNIKIDELFEKHNIAGITATILIPQKGIWETNRGFISKIDNKPVDSSSVFYWASVSKIITSTIVSQLIVEDKISLDDKLSLWFPEFQHSKKITIEQLLTHTNGIYSFNSDSTVHFSNKHFNPNELLDIAKSKENLFNPGEYWSYTNTGYLLLALIIEKVESKPFNKIVEERISERLKLKTLSAPKKMPTNLAIAHNKDSIIRKDYSIPLGAGNIISNSKDMAVFFSALLTGKLIPLEEVHKMMKDLYPMYDNGQYYGKGIMLYDFNEINQTNNSWIGHSGGTENYKAIVAYDMQTEIIIAISINENIPVGAVVYKLLELIIE